MIYIDDSFFGVHCLTPHGTITGFKQDPILKPAHDLNNPAWRRSNSGVTVSQMPDSHVVKGKG